MQKSWFVKDLLEWTTRYFREKGIDEPRLEAEVLLAHILGKNRVYLYTNYDAPVNQHEREKFRESIKRRVKREPLAYIVGYKEFMSLEFRVSPAVLIPRPETELLVENVLDIITESDHARICDVGTGSGAIAISIAFYNHEASVYAVDLSEDAVGIARENATRHNVNIDLRQGDLLQPFTGEKQFDVIVANLPYIPENEYRELDTGIIRYEPVGALVAPGDGLDLYRQLVPRAFEMLAPGGYLLVEIAYNQGAAALNLMQAFKDKEIIKDLAGHDRVVKARKE
ncbi:MAG: peptide chain release factor N(5)-glutamine methyltransferase [Syntrophomonadaceae bacterium]|nr:peptide chain release factor N(5)-glutamine methyltransferase [Syntrophomonadaceae bacterium]MDD3888589.1 peptide chain release factor N(5)-glutamine methyltransferase [Syntrophomonadaceae bacterium]MDD4549148.1 peptide chain release factor N(5)-glutamine methyltransferase [Syntrophomonadaceae bacterium]